LAAGIFHELHNYMNMIVNGAGPLRAGMIDLKNALPERTDIGDVDLDELVELAELVVTASGSAREVTGELKGFAHQDRGSNKLVDLHGVLQSTIRLFGKHDTSLVVDVRACRDALVVECIPSRLTQVFTNL